MIGAGRLRQLAGLIQEGRKHLFYSWPEWLRLREEVLALDYYECQRCKARGRYSRAVLVHHVKHLEERPDLALSIRDPDTGERQLISVCRQCHDELHPEALRKFPNRRRPLTAERWD